MTEQQKSWIAGSKQQSIAHLIAAGAVRLDEFPSNPQEAFQSSGRTIFDAHLIAAGAVRLDEVEDTTMSPRRPK